MSATKPDGPTGSPSAWSGVETLQGQARLLGTPAKALHAILMGRAMPDAIAREIEWT
jgi:hypothetical protein